MEYRQLGTSGLRVSALTMGTMTFGGSGIFTAVGNTDVDTARRQFDMCRDHGVNLIDTADKYSDGASEEIIGAALAGHRDDWLIATKVRFPMGEGPNDAGLSRHHLLDAAEASLQLYHSLQSRDAESDLLPASLDQGLGVLVWGPLAGGLLSGKFSRGADGGLVGPSGARQSSDWSEPPIDYPHRLFATLDVLAEIADGLGVSGARVALAWLLSRPVVTSLVVGARTEEQLADNLAAADLVLSDDEIAELERVSRPPLTYPHWHQAATAGDRLGEPDRILLGPHLN